MIHKKFAFGKEGREKIIATAELVGKVLGSTLGRAGRNYFLPTGITNDGRTIMSQLRFKDEIQDQAALAFHEVARQTDKDAGDGTTTSIVVACELATTILEKVPDLDVPVAGQESVIELTERLEKEKDEALVLLKKHVKKVESLDDLKKVAFTSMENREAANLIAEAMWEAGKDAYPILETGVNEKIEKDVIDGVRWPLKPAFRMQNKTMVFERCAVLVVNHAFEEYSELTPIMAAMLNHKKATNEKPEVLVIVAKHFSVPFVGAVSEVQAKTNLPIMLLAADFHNDTFEDIAAYVDATALDTHPKTGKKIKDLNKWGYAGHMKKLIVTEKDATFIGGQGKEAVFNHDKGVTNRVTERVAELEKQSKEEKDATERNHIDKRIAALSGGIITLYVDAKTDAERYYLKLKTEDAMNSCRAALTDGVVKGGGETLKAIAEELGENSLLYPALIKPAEKIISNNMGKPFDLTDVWDAYAVAKASIENPVSVVKVLVTIEGIISDVEPDLVKQLQEKIVSE